MLENVSVSTPDFNSSLPTEFRVYDCLTATGFLVCFIIGLPGNCLALKYFIQTKKRNLSTVLYIVACSIDICSSVIHLPVAFNWLNGRSFGILGNTIFCSMWYFILLLLQQMSMFVVMLISLSRTIVIVNPFYEVNKKAILMSIIINLIYHCFWNILHFLSASELHYNVGFCQMYSESFLNTLYQVNFSISSGVPPIIVFLAFLVSVGKLRKSDMADESQKHNRQASITITYFAAIFLFCNFPTFMNNALFTFTMTKYKSYPGPIYRNDFMFFYSWLLTELFFLVLNASLNPVLYFWRMKDMRTWVLRLCGRLSH